jgi:hypothetical protein
MYNLQVYSTTTFADVELFIVCHTQFVGILMPFIHRNFRFPSSNVSFVIISQIFCKSTMLLLFCRKNQLHKTYN